MLKRQAPDSNCRLSSPRTDDVSCRQMEPQPRKKKYNIESVCPNNFQLIFVTECELLWLCVVYFRILLRRSADYFNLIRGLY